MDFWIHLNVPLSEDFTICAPESRPGSTNKETTMFSEPVGGQFVKTWLHFTSLKSGYPVTVSINLPGTWEPSIKFWRHKLTYLLHLACLMFGHVSIDPFLHKTVCNQKSFTKRSGSKMSTVWLQNVTFTKWVGLHLFLNTMVCNQKSFTKRSGSKMSLSQNGLLWSRSLSSIGLAPKCYFHKMSWSPSVSEQNGLQPEVFHKTVCLAPKCHLHKMSWSPSVFKQNGLQPEVFHQTVWLQNVTFTKWVGLHLFF